MKPIAGLARLPVAMLIITGTAIAGPAHAQDAGDAPVAPDWMSDSDALPDPPHLGVDGVDGPAAHSLFDTPGRGSVRRPRSSLWPPALTMIGGFGTVVVAGFVLSASDLGPALCHADDCDDGLASTERGSLEGVMVVGLVIGAVGLLWMLKRSADNRAARAYGPQRED